MTSGCSFIFQLCWSVKSFPILLLCVVKVLMCVGTLVKMLECKFLVSEAFVLKGLRQTKSL